jgi:hypothetical protein
MFVSMPFFAINLSGADFRALDYSLYPLVSYTKDLNIMLRQWSLFSECFPYLSHLSMAVEKIVSKLVLVLNSRMHVESVFESLVLWLMTVILATWGAEIGRAMVPVQSKHCCVQWYVSVILVTWRA